jgi:hypothetical protein
MSAAIDEAAGLLKHYVRLAFDAAGKPWDPDYAAELDAILDPVRDLDRRVDAIETELERQTSGRWHR